ncbi:MAG TPA: MHYT domain-containing protein [Micromonosporaceae bacterium]|nr:MHYT domain-containing protein [Micromonosporaceae bacterium]
MAEVHHFTYGLFTPVAAYLMAFLGSTLGLLCTARARRAHTPGRRTRWLVLAAIAIGGAGIWLMHFMAMLGFEVPGSPVRYDPVRTFGSMALAVLTVGAGVFIAGGGRRSFSKILIGGALTGAGVLAMHYSGMSAMHVAGRITYDPRLVAASGVIAVGTATVALWFTVSIRGWWPILAAAAIMGVAVCGMHYTGMAAIRVRLDDAATTPVGGSSPFLLIVPITLLAAAALIGLAFSALQAMTEEEFTDGYGPSGRRGGAHAGPRRPRTAPLTGPPPAAPAAAPRGRETAGPRRRETAGPRRREAAGLRGGRTVR